MVKYIASISFGKDSLAMLLKVIEYQMPLDEVVYCEPWFNDELSGEFPEMADFIKKAEKILKRRFGIKVTHIKAKQTFEEVFYTKKQKGKFIGTNYGFPMTIRAWCNDRLKVKALDKYYRRQGQHIRYIGYAFDEPERYKTLAENEVAPLFNLGITEQQAYEICKQNKLLSPLYKYFDRIGCWFCPKQSIKSLKVLYKRYPEYWNKLKELQKDSLIPFKPNKTIFELEERFRKEVNNEQNR